MWVVPWRTYPVVATYVVVAINLLIFVLMTLAGGSTNPEVLLRFGASYGPLIHRGEYWRLVMPMFLHIGLAHLLVNAFALFILGRILERVYGYGRFAFLYVGAGICSSALSMSVSAKVAAGASGAIFGLAGAMLVAGYRHQDALPWRLRRVFGRGILPFIVVNLIMGYLIPGIDNWGHLGGLLGGIALAWVIPPPVESFPPSSTAEHSSQAMVVVPLAVVMAAMAVTGQQYLISRQVGRLLNESMRLRAQKQDEQARQVLQEAVRIAPRDARPREQLGVLFLEQDQVDAAIRELEEALALNPSAGRAELRLALAYLRKGDPTRVERLITSLVGKEVEPAVARQVLGDLCYQNKLLQDASKYYLEAIQLNPNLAVAHNNLAWLYATAEDPNLRDPQAALEHAERAVELTQGREATFLDTLAEAHFALGNIQEAIRIEESALQLAPHNRELQRNMERYRKAKDSI